MRQNNEALVVKRVVQKIEKDKGVVMVQSQGTQARANMPRGKKLRKKSKKHYTLPTHQDLS